jgi:hypothetical protein
MRNIVLLSIGLALLSSSCFRHAARGPDGAIPKAPADTTLMQTDSAGGDTVPGVVNPSYRWERLAREAQIATAIISVVFALWLYAYIVQRM